MSLIHPDIDNIIVSYIFSHNRKSNYKRLQNIYHSFGRSYFDKFIITCKEYYFEQILFKQIFNENEINNIYTFLQKITHKKNPKFYECYIKLYREIGNSLIKFESLNKKSKLIIKYLSLYNGYLTVHINKKSYETFGYNYYDIHSDERYKNKPLTFKFLKQKLVHNLDYYDLVEKKDNIYDSTFILKKDAQIYKRGITKDVFDVDCIRIV
jgi:hypothetical protein